MLCAGWINFALKNGAHYFYTHSKQPSQKKFEKQLPIMEYRQKFSDGQARYPHGFW